MYEVWIDATARPALHPDYADAPNKGRLGSCGPAAIGIVIKRGSNVVETVSKFIGIYDNNAAEYKAFIEAMYMLVELEAVEVLVHTDSNLLERQMNDHYSCRSERIVDLYLEAKKLAYFIPNLRIEWIPRRENSIADKLAEEVFKDWDGSLLED